MITYVKDLDKEKPALANLIIKTGYGCITNATVIEHSNSVWVMDQEIFIKLEAGNIDMIKEYFKYINTAFITNGTKLRATIVDNALFIFLEEGDEIHDLYYEKRSSVFFLCLSAFRCKFDGENLPTRMDDTLSVYVSSDTESALTLDYNIYNEGTFRSLINSQMNQYSLQYVGLFGSEKDIYPKLKGFINGVRDLDVFKEPSYVRDSFFKFEKTEEVAEPIDG